MNEGGSYVLDNKDLQLQSTGIFKSLYFDKKFSDVTLVTSDRKRFECHRAILSSFGTFFEEILTDSINPNSLIYLKGISSEVLEALLEFIYLGTTQVKESGLSEVLNVAKDLKIYGLGDDVNEETDTQIDQNREFKNSEGEGNPGDSVKKKTNDDHNTSISNNTKEKEFNDVTNKVIQSKQDESKNVSDNGSFGAVVTTMISGRNEVHSGGKKEPPVA